MLVNTCAVRDNAEQRVIGRMGELQRHKRPGDVLGVVGCMAQRLGPALLERVPRVDLVVGPDALPQPARADRPRGAAASGSRDTEFRAWEHYEDVPPVRETGPTAFVTVQRGCDYRCTFCIVPYTRGPERSRRLADVVARGPSARRRRAPPRSRCSARPSTATTTAQHDFADLLRAVGAVDGIRRVRFTSPYPTDFTPRVIEAMADHAGGVRARASAGAERLERRCSGGCFAATPGSAISRSCASCARPCRASRSPTDIIVGFPGETDAQFEETLSLVADAGFRRRLHLQVLACATARRRCGCSDHVARRGGVRAARAAHRGGARATRAARTSARVGQTHEVLVERPARRGDLMLGRTRSNQLVLLDLPADRGRRVSHGADSPAPPAPPSPGRSVHAHTGGAVIRNLAEEHVTRAYDSLRPRFPGVLRLRYVPGRRAGVHAQSGAAARTSPSRQGSVVTEVSLEKDQNRAAIDVAMMEALRKISLAPRCGRRAGHRQT